MPAESDDADSWRGLEAAETGLRSGAGAACPCPGAAALRSGHVTGAVWGRCLGVKDPPGWEGGHGGGVHGLHPCVCFPFAVTCDHAANKQTVNAEPGVHACKASIFKVLGPWFVTRQIVGNLGIEYLNDQFRMTSSEYMQTTEADAAKASVLKRQRQGCASNRHMSGTALSKHTAASVGG